MQRQRLGKTFADYMVIGLSPVLIMGLVGSLTFFLIQVFYRGDMVLSVRWVMFWFVIATVLVSRIGIEQGATQAIVYGLGLAVATWLYLVRTHPAPFLGLALLALIWWCAHRLTWDCTLIDEDQDASGAGLLEATLTGSPAAIHTTDKVLPPPGTKARLPTTSSGRKKPSRPPGVWVVYFSLAALPLFGLGQVLLPREDTGARRIGFALLAIYLMAALGLLLSTSFLGLRRYLRQRFVKMPDSIAFGWLRFGAGLTFLVLVMALLLPRPGADYTWRTLAYQIDTQLRRASEYASRENPSGQGEGRPGRDGREAGDQEGSGIAPGRGGDRQGATGEKGRPGRGGRETRDQPGPSSFTQTLTEQASRLYLLLKWLILLAIGAFVLWWLVRSRRVILQMVRAALEALRQFFSRLFGLGATARSPSAPRPVKLSPKTRPFAAFQNPFVTARDRTWPPERVVLYSYEALQAWGREQGIEPRPPQTASEFCVGVGEKFPEIEAALGGLAFLYGHVAYGRTLPEGYDLESIRELWLYLSAGVSTQAAR